MALQFKGIKAKMFMMVYKFVEVHDGLYCGHKRNNVYFHFSDEQSRKDCHDTLVELNLTNVTFRNVKNCHLMVTI